MTSADNVRDDSGWFSSFQRGDAKAFRKVFDTYYRPICFFTAKIIQDDGSAEDITSETFKKAWDYRAKFITLRHLENFLYMVARNACISYLRREKFAATKIKDWLRISGESAEEGTPLDFERLQTSVMARIFQRLDELPGGDIIRMAYIEGKSTKEIALAKNMSENNVYIVKSRTLKALRMLLSTNELFFFILIFLKN